MEPEIPESMITLESVVLLLIVALALLTAHRISVLERRMLAGAAILLAGLFYMASPTVELPLLLVGVVSWVSGAYMVTKAGMEWHPGARSGAAPYAVVLLLPTAFFGALLLGAVVMTALVAPARLLARIVGG